LVTELFDQLQWGDAPPATMICGPEPMMAASARRAGELGVSEDRIWLSMERNMQCATGHCGHCQFGPAFVCKDGPVFSYPEIKAYLGQRGF
jgi:NAD(P)H-flavin reductase